MEKEDEILKFIQIELRNVFEISYFQKTVNPDHRYGITLEIRTKENGYDKKPHCHAKYEDKSISISLIDYSILEEHGFNENMKKKAVKLIKEYKNQLDKLWKKYHGIIEL